MNSPKHSEKAGSSNDFQKELEAELERLKQTLKLNYELKVMWAPNKNSKISGEVKGNYIHVYEEDREAALETLKHEFIDYAISHAIEPYKEVTNRLISLINEIAYMKKERLVEAFARLIS